MLNVNRGSKSKEGKKVILQGTRDEIQAIVYGIAMLGTKGLSVKDPSGKYALRSLPGNFSGLQLLCEHRFDRIVI